MHDKLWEYAKKLVQSGDPDSPQVRGLVQRHEEDPAFQDMVGRINSLHIFQQEIEADSDKNKKKRASKRKSKS